jgi:hypothetical protein
MAATPWYWARVHEQCSLAGMAQMVSAGGAGGVAVGRGALLFASMSMDLILRLRGYAYGRRHLWVALSGIAFAFAYCIYFGACERHFRWAGDVLQLGGVFSVVWGISKTREDFGHSSLWSAAASWIARMMPLRKVPHVTAALTGVETGGDVASIHGTVSEATRDVSVSGRLLELENRVDQAHERITVVTHTMAADLSATRDVLASETQSLKAADAQLRAALENTATGGVHISATGAAWLFLGVFLSTWAIELDRCPKPPI